MTQAAEPLSSMDTLFLAKHPAPMAAANQRPNVPRGQLEIIYCRSSPFVNETFDFSFTFF
jgi:hypothetical protein